MSSDNKSTPSNPKICYNESISPANGSQICDPIFLDNDSPNSHNESMSSSIDLTRPNSNQPTIV